MATVADTTRIGLCVKRLNKFSRFNTNACIARVLCQILTNYGKVKLIAMQLTDYHFLLQIIEVPSVHVIYLLGYLVIFHIYTAIAKLRLPRAAC